eukprot:sb/3479108/
MYFFRLQSDPDLPGNTVSPEHPGKSGSDGIRFMKTIKIIFAEGGEKDDTGDMLKAVNPLSPLPPLSAHVNDPEVNPLQTKHVLVYTLCRYPRPGNT